YPSVNQLSGSQQRKFLHPLKAEQKGNHQQHVHSLGVKKRWIAPNQQRILMPFLEEGEKKYYYFSLDQCYRDIKARADFYVQVNERNVEILDS
ncbi:hypothetical protein ACJX0J_035404, partial [Zea mays]